ncbi:rot1 [Hyphodiscus hymeniophilus]|uniref:Protein ROT1 n=1 Tax=Hyphodiscus hymeniophilus TaxID=353542 RepID=A0A9P6VJQ0_9HELO|nr:rot1 [Hyphodiscus hymeniophilus]
MAHFTLHSLLLAGAYLIGTTNAQLDHQLVGTWSTKSAKVLTGPGFYNPVNDSFIEPSHTGISYSFTADGFYEEAYYRAVSNPADPSCPSGIMQFQHGTIVMNTDLSLSLSPFEVDGRQLLSDPCSANTATYTRYNQSETFSKWQVYIDPYTKLTRLDLYQVGGAPLNPMFLAYSPPQMLPTVTMNPTLVASASATAKAKSKRGLEDLLSFPLNQNAKHIKRDGEVPLSLLQRIDLNLLWWTGIGLTVFGGAAYIL